MGNMPKHKMERCNGHNERENRASHTKCYSSQYDKRKVFYNIVYFARQGISNAVSCVAKCPNGQADAATRNVAMGNVENADMRLAFSVVVSTYRYYRCTIATGTSWD